jgi:ABC transporter substrate binding protein (PQQ-dependent alcohol dehydrogenase system)
MTSNAWSAWLAIKVLWESSLRVKSTDAKALAGHLELETPQFDGHKGQPLSFRAWDHQMRQPVYVVGKGSNGERVVREVPEVSADDSPRDALDRLGARARESACRFAR